MVAVTPCINLNGQCEEATTLYEKAFGATTKFMMRYEDADKQDWDKPLTDDQKNMIYHAKMYTLTLQKALAQKRCARSI